jgi:glucosamine--fructose-6-phosphate aminotransferase (isomerizing)
VGTTSAFDQDLREQPEVLAGLIDEGRREAEAAAARIRERGPAFAVLAARGSSDNAARYAQYLLGVRNGLVAALAAPSVITRYGAKPRMQAGLVIGISQSGQSPDLVAVVREARAQGALTLAVTNEPASPLAEAAELLLALRAGHERAVAATKTYTAQLTALAMLSAALSGGEAAWRELERVPQRVAEAMARSRDAVTAASSYREDDQMLVVGRGFNLSTAFEIALKLKEACGVVADPYSSADLLHGPVALLRPGLPVMVVAPEAAPFDDLVAVAVLARERGARVLAVTDAPQVAAQAEVAFPLPPDGPEWLSPVEAVVPGQMWVQALAAARGLTPDAPPGLSKVTLTR